MSAGDSIWLCAPEAYRWPGVLDLDPRPGIRLALAVHVAAGGRTGFDVSPASRGRLAHAVQEAVVWSRASLEALELPTDDAEQAAALVRKHASPFGLVLVRPRAELRAELARVAAVAVRRRVDALSARLGKPRPEAGASEPLAAVLLDGAALTTELAQRLLASCERVLVWLRRGGEHGLHVLLLARDAPDGTREFGGGVELQRVDDPGQLPAW